MSKRILILCEDRQTERFVEKLCNRFGVHIASVVSAPLGKGSAENWVVRKYPDLVRKHRSKKHQKNLALLVVIDGDARGVQARKQQLADVLTARGLEARGEQEQALFIPTWSLETWLVRLAAGVEVSEDRTYKHDPAFEGLWANERRTRGQAIEAWHREGFELPSLADAYIEAKRVDLV